MSPKSPLKHAVESWGRKVLVGALRLALPVRADAPKPPKNPRAILLLRVDRIGDMIVSTPAIEALRRRYPNARLDVLASPSNGRILEGNPDVNRVHSLGLSALWRLKASRWDVVADLNPAPSFTAGFLTRWARAGVRISFEKKDGELFYDVRLPADDKAHRAEEAMKVARWLDADVSPLRYRLFPGAAAEREAREFLESAGWPGGRKWVAVHPGNIKKYDNRWPEERFAVLCDRLALREDVRVLLLKGPDEDPLIESMLSHMKSRPLVAPAFGLMATACLLRRMGLVLCNSTSTLHLAAAVGTPTLSFLSGYSEACWKAPGKEHRSLVGSLEHSCRDIPVEAGWKALQEML